MLEELQKDRPNLKFVWRHALGHPFLTTWIHSLDCSQDSSCSGFLNHWRSCSYYLILVLQQCKYRIKNLIQRYFIHTMFWS
jgi:hypothetical protein